jgi:hypothetical protein
MKILAPKISALQVDPKTQNDFFIENICNYFNLILVIYGNRRYN